MGRSGCGRAAAVAVLAAAAVAVLQVQTLLFQHVLMFLSLLIFQQIISTTEYMIQLI